MKRLLVGLVIAITLLFAPPASANPDQDDAFISMLEQAGVGPGRGSSYGRMINAAHEICNSYYGGLDKYQIVDTIYSANAGNITFDQAKSIFVASVLVYCPPAGLPANQPLQPGQGWVA